MGMYTELIFQGETKPNLPTDIQHLLDYFFDEDGEEIDGELPDHPFFACPRWCHIGHMSSYYHIPFALRRSQNHVREDAGKHVFLRCDLKNYENEIELFLDWIGPYMEEYRGWVWYDEDMEPTIIKKG